jgi:hypothetical protein
VRRSLRDIGSPDNFSAYLKAHGWRRRGKEFRGAMSWTKSVEKGQIASILVPHDRSKSDYEALLAAAVDTVSKIEDVGPTEVLAKVVDPEAALLRLGIEAWDADLSGAPLTMAHEAAGILAEMISVAAYESAIRSDFSESRSHKLARRYVEGVRVADVEIGSIRVTAVLPEWLPGPQGFLAEPVPTLLVMGLRSASDLLEMNVWPSAPEVVRGASDTSVTWKIIAALSRFKPEVVERATFDTPTESVAGPRRTQIAHFDSHVLQTARDLLSRREVTAGVAASIEPDVPRHVVVRGPVIELRRPSIVVEGDVEALEDDGLPTEHRRVRVRNVPEQLYERAGIAHLDGRPVEVVGWLSVPSRTAYLDDVEQLAPI